MGNSTSKVVNDVGSFIGTALAAPFKSLLGRSCQDVCVGIWDVVCFIEHICIADLVKFLLVCCLSYICLVFLYMLYKLGLCQCIAKTSCKMCWATCESSCLALDYICCFCWHKIRYTKRVYRGRQRHRRHQHLSGDVEMGYARPIYASSADNSSVTYCKDVGSSVVGRKRKCRRKRRRRRKMKDGKSVRMNKRQLSVHLKGRSMKRSSRRRNYQFNHKQLSNLSMGRRSNTMKFKRQRTR
ncbi:Protein HAPLESS 2 [Bienertia sinuspersici]